MWWLVAEFHFPAVDKRIAAAFGRNMESELLILSIQLEHPLVVTIHLEASVEQSKRCLYRLYPRKLIHGSLTIINIRIIIPAMVLCAQDLVNRVDCSWLGDGQILRLPQIQRSRCT